MNIPDGAEERIREIPHFRDSIYHDLDVERTLDFFHRRFIEPLSRWVEINQCVSLDCACGYGWFSFAFVQAGGRLAIGADLDVPRLLAAREIAKILEVDDRMRFLPASLSKLPLRDRSIDLTVSIETLEHVPPSDRSDAIREIGRISAEAVLLTTPNRIFPVVAHDTRIPFLHWLPAEMRGPIARLFAREEMDHGNVFVAPWDLRPLADGFERVSTCHVFSSYEDFVGQYPIYLPYGRSDSGREQVRPGTVKSLIFRLASKLLDRWSFWILPSLAGLYLSSDSTRSTHD